MNSLRLLGNKITLGHSSAGGYSKQSEVCIINIQGGYQLKLIL